MKKLQIKLEYLDKVYWSAPAEVTDTEIQSANEMVSNIAMGKTTNLSIINGDLQHYFTEKILSESIITVIIS